MIAGVQIVGWASAHLHNFSIGLRLQPIRNGIDDSVGLLACDGGLKPTLQRHNFEQEVAKWHRFFGPHKMIIVPQ